MNRLAVYGAVLAAVLGAGGWGGWHFGSAHWQAKYEALRADDWQGRAQRAETARKAVEGQIDTLQKALGNNAKVMHELEEKHVTVESQLGTARRLLAAAKAAGASRGCPVPEAGSGRPSAEAGEAAGDRGPGAVPDGGEFGDLLERAISAVLAECKGNANNQDALIAEIKPQL